MSHRRYARLAITQLNQELAQNALREIMKIHGGVLQGSRRLTIYWNRYGYFGVDHADGQGSLLFNYDDFAAPLKLDQFRQLFTQQYNALAIQQAFARMGRPVQVATQNGKVYIRGVAA